MFAMLKVTLVITAAIVLVTITRRPLRYMAGARAAYWLLVGTNQPMLVGAWRSRIVLLIDFDLRYSQEERKIVIAHKLAHLQRHDAAINAVAALWLCHA